MLENIGEKIKQLDIKKLIVIGFICIVAILFTTFMFNTGDGKHILKSEYGINELGYLDKIEVTLEKVNYIHNNTAIELTFKITNQTDKTITITPDDYFKFYDINEVQIPNKNTSNQKIIKKDETTTYKLQYDVTKKELYEIYFYSQVVENNIKFSFKSSDISEEIITDSNMTQEEKSQ
ncbi:MAG: hypothetical protein IJL74_02855 [Bacilli bacterium]|nr:hypothetical protein [Bacilli bacterium]